MFKLEKTLDRHNARLQPNNCLHPDPSHFSLPSIPLKVVTNEKLGGSGSCLVFEDGFGPWRSMSVYFFI
jgi:hypothetical protein